LIETELNIIVFQHEIIAVKVSPSKTKITALVIAIEVLIRNENIYIERRRHRESAIGAEAAADRYLKKLWSVLFTAAEFAQIQPPVLLRTLKNSRCCKPERLESTKAAVADQFPNSKLNSLKPFPSQLPQLYFCLLLRRCSSSQQALPLPLLARTRIAAKYTLFLLLAMLRDFRVTWEAFKFGRVVCT
jgi:hypothetical protein